MSTTNETASQDRDGASLRLLPLSKDPFQAPTDRDMLPSERRRFVETHRTCVFGYGRRSDGPAMSVVYYVPAANGDLLVATMGARAKAKGRCPKQQGQPLRPRRDLAVLLPAGLLRRRNRPDGETLVDVMMAVAERMSGEPLGPELRPMVKAMGRRGGPGARALPPLRDVRDAATTSAPQRPGGDAHPLGLGVDALGCRRHPRRGMTFRFANVEGRSALVDSDGRWFDASRVSGGVVHHDPMEAWLHLDELHLAASAIGTSQPDGHVSDADLRPPIPAPRSVFAVGLNYRYHAEESNMDLPKTPLIFTKFPSCLVGPNDPVILGGTTDDYEAELVVVIGLGGRDISPTDAWDHVGGLTVGQDISDRTLQFAAEPRPFRSRQVP